MGFYEKPKGRRAEVGGDEQGTKTIIDYQVNVEYWCVRENGSAYTMFWTEYFDSKEECIQFVHRFSHGIVRQAWIDKITTIDERSKVFEHPVLKPEVRKR